MKHLFVQASILLAPVLLQAAPAVAQAAAASPAFVAGLAPYQRPANTPTVKQFAAGAEWRKHALTGVSEPIPASLGFLDDQGAWYTPFTHPGMPGPYDLRQWHQAGGGTNKTSR